MLNVLLLNTILKDKLVVIILVSEVIKWLIMLCNYRVGSWPPGKFMAKLDWKLLIKRFELYVREAGIKYDKKVTKLISPRG